MNYRTPLQHVLRHLMPSAGRAPAAAQDFVDTRPSAADAAPARLVWQDTRPLTGWGESALDLVLGTEILEYEDGTSADLMDEFFAKSDERAR